MIPLDIVPPEVLHIICRILLQSDVSKRSKEATFAGVDTLLVLARTSRAFHEHALNVLWHTIPGYGPLIYTLPSNVWTQELQPPEFSWSPPSTCLSLTRPLACDDLTRLKHYARRVKRILWPSDCGWLPPRSQGLKPPPSVLEAFATLLATMPGTVLLPNLTALHIIDRTETVREKSVLFRSLYVLFGPKLRIFRGHCAAGTRTPGDALGYAIQKLAEISPGLVYLNLFPTGRSSHACPLISNALCSLLHLSDVAIASTPISLKAFLHLARLPSLRTLGVLLENGIEERVLAALAESDDANYLPQLTGLSLIYDGGMRVASTIIRKVRSPHLRNVRIINESESVHSLDMHELFLSIAICKGYASIRSVYVTVSEIPEDDAITEYTIAPLLILQKLTELRIRASGRFSINDLACLVIAKTWPDLRTLNLGPQRLDETPPATLTGLVYLAQGCRHLHSLGLAINPDVARLPRICKLARPGLGFVQKKLVTMDVGRSKIRDPMAVAAFLSDLFPKLDNIDDGFPCEEDAYDEYVETEEEREKILADAVHHTRWSEVMFDFLPEFVQIRKQERRWGLRHGEQPIARVKII